MIDLSQESEQIQPKYGPVPAGSIVVVSMTLRDPGEHMANDNPVIYVAKSGLRQMYCQFEVIKGQYQGVNWRQSITLPISMQVISLTESQKTACRIGGATMRAIMEASGRSLQISDLLVFNGLRFPVRVKLNKEPYEKDGMKYWRNEISMVITPSMEDYKIVKRDGEIINPKGQTSLESQSQESQQKQQQWQDSQWQEPQQNQWEQPQQNQNPYGSESYMNTFINQSSPPTGSMPAQGFQHDADRVMF